MAIEHILALVAFIVVVLTLSLLLPTKSRGYRTDGSGDGASAGWFSDGADCGAGSGGSDGGGGGD